MDMKKIIIGLIVLFTFMGISVGVETWVQETVGALYIEGLTSTIHIHIKNNKDHVVYFKISNRYFLNPKGGGGGNNSSRVINWRIDWTDPPATKMVKSIYPELGGDYGWAINPGETKTICFKLSAVGPGGDIPAYIERVDSQENQYWPLISEPGIMADWFEPSEIEMLNTDLDLQFWQGKFSFTLINIDSQKVAGIMRAPIVPMNSKLTYSNPKVTFIDKDLVFDANIAAWNVVMESGASRYFTYTYEWPYYKAGSSHTGTAPSYTVPTSAANGTPSVPTKETGAAYGLFIVGAIITAAGLVYAKLIR